MKRFLSSLLAALLVWAPVAQAIGPAFALHQTTLLSSVCNDKPVAYWNLQKSTVSQAAATERVSAVSDLCANANSIAQATAANQPIYVSAAAGHAWNRAVASNTISTTTTSITGNWTFTFDLAEDDYTPSGNITLLDKSSGNDGFKVLLLTTGVIRVAIGDGVAVTNFNSTVANGKTDFARHTFVATYVDNATLDFTIDGAALGTQVVVNKVLTNAAVAMTLGPWNGKLYGYSLTNGDATTYYGKTLSTVAEGATSYTDDTGKTATVNQSGATPAKIVVAGQPSLLLNGAAYYMQTGVITLPTPYTFIAVNKAITHIHTGRLFDGLVTNEFTVTQVDPSPTQQVADSVGASSGVAATLGQWWITTAQQVAGGAAFIKLNLGDNNSATLTDTAMTGITLGRKGNTASGYGNFQVKALAVFSSALSAIARTRYACGVFGVFHNLGLSC